MNPKFLWGGILLGIDLMINPSFKLFSVVLILIALDFITGITKAKFKKNARTSEGYRKTIVKVLQYIVPILVLWIAGRYIPEQKATLQSCSGYVMMFILYIEATSIFENLYEIDKTSMIAKYLYRPALVLLKVGIEKNAVTEAAKKVDADQNTAVLEVKP